MNLTVAERIMLLEILPPTGDFLTLKIVRGLRESLSFDEEEIQKLDFKQEANHVRWNAVAETLKNISIGAKANDIIVQSLKELDERKLLTEQHLALYEKFVCDHQGA